MRQQRFRNSAGFTILEMLFVVLILGVLFAVSVPMTGNALQDMRVTGSAQSISNAVSVTKMRAAANFTKSRLMADLSGGTFTLQTWDKTATSWVSDSGTTNLATDVAFGFGSLDAPPPNTQGVTIFQAPACLDDDGTAIGNSACIIFNSRGVPIDDTGTPIATDALYVKNATAVYGVTVSATGLIRLWHANPTAGATWTQQ